MTPCSTRAAGFLLAAFLCALALSAIALPPAAAWSPASKAAAPSAATPAPTTSPTEGSEATPPSDGDRVESGALRPGPLIWALVVLCALATVAFLRGRNAT